MPVSIASVGSVLVARMTGVYEAAEVQRAYTELVASHRRARTLITYVAIAAPGLGLPQDAETRRVCSDLLRSAYQHCDTIHLVAEGEGVGQVFMRGFGAALILVAGRRGQIFVHSGRDEVESSVAPALHADLRRALASVASAAPAKNVVTSQRAR